MKIENVKKEIINGVLNSVPEVKLIKDQRLQELVCLGWAYSLQVNGYNSIEEMEHSGTPGVFASAKRTQADHIRWVARIAIAMTTEIINQFEEFTVDTDEVIAGAICHDIGKPFEYRKENRQRWQKHPEASGNPAIRHSVYGVHVALTVGLPETIAHIAGAHSKEGQFVERSLVAEIVHFADEAYWHILAKAQIVN
jgi:putative nucleotidyltransferase with HDIG domain